MNKWGGSVAAAICGLTLSLPTQASVALSLDPLGHTLTAQVTLPADARSQPVFLVLRSAGGNVSASEGERNLRDSMQSWVVRWEQSTQPLNVQIPLILENTSPTGVIVEARLFSTDGMKTTAVALAKKNAQSWEITTDLRRQADESASRDGRETGLAKMRPIPQRSTQRLKDTESPILERRGAQ